jgi:superfamily II DNA helicase RecQ
MMGRKRVPRVRYTLDSNGIKDLPFQEIKAILRGADPLVMSGGRTLLAKLLKGSKDKKILELKLDQCPVYGYFKIFTIEEITAKIDWVIENGYLEIKYDYRLPLLAFTEDGWEIEKDTYSDELLANLTKLFDGNNYQYVNELKDRNRGMILLLIEKIKLTGDKGYIPVLKAWEKIECQKLQKLIREVIAVLAQSNPHGNEKKVVSLDEFKKRKIPLQ